jgi:type II secretory pathway component PulM
MTVELQPIFNLAISALVGVAIYFFKMVQNHEKRIQKVEDIFSIKFEHLITEIESMKKEVEHLSKMVHKAANQETNMNTALNMLIEKLKDDEKNI